MTDSDFDQVFGRRPEPKQSFVQRVTGGQTTNVHPDPIAAMTVEAATKHLAEMGSYKAFGFVPAGNVNPSCEVRSFVDGTDVSDGVVFFYRLLMEIAFTGTTELRLKLPDSIIVVSGRNLEPLRQALTRHTATYIQQFSKRIWSTQIGSDAPLIERIEIIRP